MSEDHGQEIAVVVDRVGGWMNLPVHSQVSQIVFSSIFLYY